jgi:2',3'-cyclic-nucleotide 2'-phosphodiesterase (5'-nucleotidase family)
LRPCNQLDPTLDIPIAEDTLFLSSPSKETKFTPMAEALPATVTKIKAENPDVNIIIAVGHAGNAVDLKVSAVVLHG